MKVAGAGRGHIGSVEAGCKSVWMLHFAAARFESSATRGLAGVARWNALEESPSVFA